jgi:hypothetical protein
VKVESLGLTVNGTPVVLDPQGQANVKVNNLGNFTAIATALDAAGNAGFWNIYGWLCGIR